MAKAEPKPPTIKSRFNPDKGQRNFAAKHLMNAGYGALAAMSLSQVLVNDKNWWLVVLGILIYAVCWRAAYTLKRGTE